MGEILAITYKRNLVERLDLAIWVAVLKSVLRSFEIDSDSINRYLEINFSFSASKISLGGQLMRYFSSRTCSLGGGKSKSANIIISRDLFGEGELQYKGSPSCGF